LPLPARYTPMPAVASRRRCPRRAASSSAPPSVNGVRLMTNVLWRRPLTTADPTWYEADLTRRIERMPDRTRDQYRLISADSHVNEPPDLWTTRVPAEYRDRAPRIERFDQGDAWVLEGVDDSITFGMNACAGMAAEELRGWIRFEAIRR